jgi:hypothetical protein
LLTFVQSLADEKKHARNEEIGVSVEGEKEGKNGRKPVVQRRLY